MFFFHVLLLLETYFVRVLYLFVVDVVFVVLVKDYLKHMIEVFVFLMRFSHCRTWLKIGLPVDNIRISLLDDSLAYGDNWSC